MKKLMKEYNGKTMSELDKFVKNLRVDIAKTRLNMKVNPTKDTNALVKKKKQLAVALTVITQKKDAEQLKSEK